jgi:hypothetical protein
MAENSVNGVTYIIKNGIEAALAAIRADRADSAVTTPAPRQYFIYEQPKGYLPPAVFTMVDRIDFHKDRGANFHAATVQMSVAILVENIRSDQLTIQAWRYQDALLAVLDRAQYLDPNPDNPVKFTVLVKNAVFTPAYSSAGKDPDGTFRKEVHLACDLEHYSNY